MSKTNITVIIPALNESATILGVVEKCLQVTDHVIVVDDGSNDNTGALVAKEYPHVRVMFHDRSKGKGSALLTALPHVNTPLVALQDADCEYDPLAILTLMAATPSDMVVGQRTMLMTDFYREVGICSFVANSVIARIIGSPDVFSGQRVLRTEFMRGMGLRSKGFEIETEMTIRAIDAKADIRYIPVSYSPRTKEMGKKIGSLDFLKILVMYARLKIAGALHRQLPTTRSLKVQSRHNAFPAEAVE